MWSNLTARLKPAGHRSTKHIGDKAEGIARRYLTRQGLSFIAQNVRYRYGEIDLVMQDGKLLVFVEVRYRKNLSHGGALASVDYHKQQKLMKAASLYLQATYGNNPPACRFDVVGVSEQPDSPKTQTSIQWIKNAFC